MATKNKSKAAAKSAPGEPKTYEVVSPLKFDGEKYAPGSTVDMDESDAEELIKLGVLADPATK